MPGARAAPPWATAKVIMRVPPRGRYRQRTAATHPKGDPPMSRTYTLDDLSRLVDHTNLHADATEADMAKLCD